jgi:dTDP-4-amino-4,6-dideoxygalactose transaminase
MPPEPVPFMDLGQQHRELEPELTKAVLPLLRAAAFVGGEPVGRFEEAFARAHDMAHAVTAKSGTAALHLGLLAMGIGEGDEVLVPAYTFIATAAAVAHAGATPVFVDVDPEIACMDPEAARAAVTSRMKAMIPVHLYGHPAPIEPLCALASELGLRVLEDCAQSHFATWKGQRTGTFGDAGAFSFYPSKNLGAGGDAGCLITRDAVLAERARKLANHGRVDRYHHDPLGYNERLDAIQAAILDVKLRHLPDWTDRRRQAAARYGELLDGLAPWGEPLRLPVQRANARHVYHLYVVRHPRRNDLANALAEAGIGTATHYPTALPDQPAIRSRGLGEGSYPVAREWAETCLSLPFFPEITPSQQERVAEAIQALSS